MIGVVGSGNMARALVLGWGEPALCTDVVADRARALAEAVGGEALAGNGELADRSEIVVLCHKPAQLETVAQEIGGRAQAVVSILGGTPLARLQAAYPDTPVVRMLPSTPVEVCQGVSIHAADPDGDPGLTERVVALFGRLGPVVSLDEGLVDVAMGLMSCAPAYYALVAEAQIDAGVRGGLPADVAAELVVGTMAGSAALLREHGMDTLAVRRAVTSPGGITARGLDALESAGLRTAFSDALDAVLRDRP
jgi:pyrroline-5-carboxylate reductase